MTVTVTIIRHLRHFVTSSVVLRQRAAGFSPGIEPQWNTEALSNELDLYSLSLGSSRVLSRSADRGTRFLWGPFLGPQIGRWLGTHSTPGTIVRQRPKRRLEYDF
jgi:hypothetical protein